MRKTFSNTSSPNWAVTEMFKETPSAQARALQLVWPSPPQHCVTTLKVSGLAGMSVDLPTPAVEPSFKMTVLLPAPSGTSASCWVQQPCAFEGCVLRALEDGCWDCWQRELVGLIHGKGSAAFLSLDLPGV